MREIEARRWAAMTAVAGTVFIAAGAFWLSFTSLADLAARSGIGAGQAWAWPLIVDGIIVVATVAVVALAGQRSAWYPWALLVGGALVSVTANAIHAVVAADADVPRILAASVAAVPPVVLLAITHLTVILTRTPEANAKASPLAAFQAVAGEAMPALPSGDPDLSAHGNDTAAVVDRRARGRELREAGWSNKRIARELGVHPSTVGRWFAVAHLTDTTDTPQQRHDLNGTDPARSVPNEPRKHPEPVEATTVPEAVRAAQIAREDKQHAIVRGRGVEWVRPTDLIARHSAHAAGRGLDFQAELARRTRTPIGAGVRRLGDRARRLPPISAFGHSHAPQAQQVSRSGVSMS